MTARAALFFLLCCSLAFLFLSVNAYAQENLHPREGERFSRDDENWYAREWGITKYLIAAAEGDPVLAIREATRREGDREADFVRSAAYAQTDQIDSALFFVRAALEKGLPVSRYQAGPSELLGKLTSHTAFSKLLAKYGAGPLVHGPRLGHVQDTSVAVWLRTDSSRQLQLEISRFEDFRERSTSTIVRTQPEREFTARLRMEGLKPAQTYYYRIRIGFQAASETYSFQTMPPSAEPARFSIAFGGGAAFIPWHRRMWSTLAEQELSAFLFLGDNVYIDYPERTYIQQYCYYRRQSEPRFREMTATTPTYAIWDDHDFGKNDSYGGPHPDTPAWKREVWRTFKNQWANPYYGGGKTQPGVWTDFRIADVDFFLLDGRYYREPSFVKDSTGPPPSMLGPAQLAWLKEKLLQSDATFKVIASPVPWSFGAKGVMEGRYDTWRGYAPERQEFFDFLTENEIKGVVLLSADRHRSDLWRIERPGDYPLYEFESSKLTNTHTHGIMPGSEFGYNEKCSFGKLIFDTAQSDPTLTYEIWNIDGEQVFQYQLRRSQVE